MTLTTFKQIYTDLREDGRLVAPRGQLTRELLGYQYTLLPYDRFAAFPSRNLKLDYIRTELRWYLKGDLEDLSIVENARIWAQMVTDGKINSNYGHYIFRQGGLRYVVDCLAGDPASRRAVITILGAEHLYVENKDVPCTCTLSFLVRGFELLCFVHMRSQDAVFGMGNDVPFFSFVQELALVLLRGQPGLNGLILGPLTVTADSFHVYARHFDLLEKLVDEEPAAVSCPRIANEEEVHRLLIGETVFQPWTFGEWLHAT